MLKETISARNSSPLAELNGEERDEKPIKAFWVPVLALLIYFHTCKQ